MDSKPALILLCLMSGATYAWVKTDWNKQLIERPFIVPSGESVYHSIYTEIDTLDREPLYGKIYVAMINGEFYFGGHNAKQLTAKEKKGQAVFVTNYLETIGEDKFFYLHNDMLRLVKTEMENKYTLETICEKAYNDMGQVDATNKNLVRFGNRIPMLYFKDGMKNKCIGTYDTLTDRFTCAEVENSIVIKEDNFLWDPETGAYTKSNRVEVLCRTPHKFPTFSN